MGQLNKSWQTSDTLAQVTQSTFTGTGQSASMSIRGSFNFSLWGTFAGTVRIERSFDNGTTWLPMTVLGSAVTFTGPATETFEEPEAGVLYRVNCTAFTSGTINYRVSQ